MKKIEPKQTADGALIDSTDHSADAAAHIETNESDTSSSSSIDSETSMNAVAISDAERLLAADALVRNHAFVAAGIGLIPMPVVDAIAFELGANTFSGVFVTERPQAYAVNHASGLIPLRNLGVQPQ